MKYCSTACQKNDWKIRHKKYCKKGVFETEFNPDADILLHQFLNAAEKDKEMNAYLSGVFYHERSKVPSSTLLALVINFKTVDHIQKMLNRQNGIYVMAGQSEEVLWMAYPMVAAALETVPTDGKHFMMVATVKANMTQVTSQLKTIKSLGGIKKPHSCSKC